MGIVACATTLGPITSGVLGLWLWLSLVLFGIAGLCWVPAAILQYKMKSLAEQSPDKEQLPALYWKYERIWSILGIAAFPAMIAIFTLMIFKPVG